MYGILLLNVCETDGVHYCLFADENNPDSGVGSHSAGASGASSSAGKMTTWSNLGSRQKSESYCTSQQQQQQQQQQHHYSRAKRREENTLNNNESGGSSNSGSGSGGEGSRKSKSLPDMGRGDSNRRAPPSSGEEEEDGETGTRLMSAFIRNKGGDRLSWNEEQALAAGNEGPIPMMRSKDTVNQYLKSAGAVGSSAEAAAAAAAAARLTSIQEDAGSEGSSRESTLRSDATGASPSAATPQTPSKSSGKRYPDLNFLEDDVGLWDAFFLHSRNSSKFHSVLGRQQQQQQQQQGRQQQQQGSPDGSSSHRAPPPLPVEEYLQQQQQQQRPHSGYNIQDLDSLRTLLPQAQRHLLPPPIPTPDQARPPLAQVCQSLSRLHIHQQQASGGAANAHDAQNQAIKSLFNQQQQQQQPAEGVQVVKVREAWAPDASAEKETAQVVVRRRSKSGRNSGRAPQGEQDLNLINNNGEDAAPAPTKEEMAAKRRSFHPTDHLSRAFEQGGGGSSGSSRRGGGGAVARRARRPSNFPKVRRST